MIAVLQKSIADILPEDINQLVSSQVLENQKLEFKESLSYTEEEDFWETKKEIRAEASEKICRVVTAFANADGGVLIIGIKQSLDNPSRAMEVKGVSACHDLAESLGQKIQNEQVIEPLLLNVSVRGLEMEAGTGKGVVVIKVAPSLYAPHWLKNARKCYRRISDRCMEMNMREIQRLTLDRARGYDENIEKILQKAEEDYNKLPPVSENSYSKILGYRITVFPINLDIYTHFGWKGLIFKEIFVRQ